MERNRTDAIPLETHARGFTPHALASRAYDALVLALAHCALPLFTALAHGLRLPSSLCAAPFSAYCSPFSALKRALQAYKLQKVIKKYVVIYM